MHYNHNGRGGVVSYDTKILVKSLKNLQEYYSDLPIKCKNIHALSQKEHIQIFFLSTVQYRINLDIPA
jgi:hypothetical protein